MDLNEYQKKAWQTRKYSGAPDRPDRIPGVVYTALGLNGEAGEVAESIKKIYRDGGGVFTSERKRAILLECGDVLWYLACLTRELNTDLQEVAEMNLEKLGKRYGS